PDMKLPIQYALGYPNRLKNDFPRFSFLEYPQLTFEKADIETFQNLGLAFAAMEKGGNAPCVLNAANEVAVDAFLKEQIGFLEMSDLISDCLAKVAYIANPSLEDFIQSDQEARRLALAHLQA
ncbi:MAG: 1-deoxy-D-xylulose-5-phosphate reductoisomerase, partial [Rufibacter sp.]